MLCHSCGILFNVHGCGLCKSCAGCMRKTLIVRSLDTIEIHDCPYQPEVMTEEECVRRGVDGVAS